jgi:hypothetical protein
VVDGLLLPPPHLGFFSLRRRGGAGGRWSSAASRPMHASSNAEAARSGARKGSPCSSSSHPIHNDEEDDTEGERQQLRPPRFCRAWDRSERRERRGRRLVVEIHRRGGRSDLPCSSASLTPPSLLQLSLSCSSSSPAPHSGHAWQQRRQLLVVGSLGPARRSCRGLACNTGRSSLWSGMHLRRLGLQFCLTSLFKGNLPLRFVHSVAAHAVLEGQKCVCTFC